MSPGSQARLARSLGGGAGLRAVALALALLSAACKGPTLRAEAQPFHLAIVPFEVVEQQVVPGSALLGFDGDAVAREFGEALDGLTFTRVTVLEPPADVTAEEFALWPRERRERHWIDGASACRADLLLLARVDFDRSVQTRSVKGSLVRGAFEGLIQFGLYINFDPIAAGISLALTVAEWRSEQRRHVVHVGFDGTLLDLGPLLDRTSEADLTNRRTQLVHSWKFETDLASTFRDREGWLGHVLSVFAPGAYFPSDPDVLATSLRERIAEGILAGLVEELEFRKLELLHGDGPFPFRVEQVALLRGRTEHFVQAEIALVTETIDAMDGYRLWVDGELVLDQSFDAPVARERGLARYALRVPLRALPDSAEVRLELRDAAPRQNARTFTLRSDRTGRRSERKLALHLPSAPPPRSPGHD